MEVSYILRNARISISGIIIILLQASIANCGWYDNTQVKLGPRDKSLETYQQWKNNYDEWIDGASKNINLSVYNEDSVSWARTSFIQPQLMVHDRFLYDRTTDTWTVGKYLDDVKERYGGIDSILLWQGYPNIGIDERNQFDMLESLPGGIDGLKQMVNDFLINGVNVLLPYLPWDQGTRNSGQSDVVSMIDAIIRSNSSGMNGDTMDGVNRSFWEESVLYDYPIVIEPEIMMSNYEYLSYDVMSWGYWTGKYPALDPVIPLVSTYKSLTNGRHLTHLCERWTTVRTNGLQYAFFNGMGYESWENVWGVFNKITPRDSAAILRTSNILRHFGEFIQGGSLWEPHKPVVQSLDSKVFASEFSGQDQKIWLLVNRDKENDEIAELELEYAPGQEEAKWIDLYHGKIIQNVTWNEDKSSVTIDIPIEAGGYGAVLMTLSDIDEDLQDFLDGMSKLSSVPLKDLSSEWMFLPQILEDLEYEHELSQNNDNPQYHSSIRTVPGTNSFNFLVQGNAIEGDPLPNAVDVQFPWEDSPRRQHEQVLEIPELEVDIYPVTNMLYKAFLDESGWTPPISDQNWLNHWMNGSYPEGFEQKPVVWVSHGDASAYCHFYGKRLPHTWEWQWIAQGEDGRPWPWGFDDPDNTRIPVFSNGREMPAPDDVNAHPMGASWSGIEDLVGNIYQWTDVFTDEHTSRAVLRGSPHWRPVQVGPINWYQPLAKQPLKEHNTFLLMSESMDRNGGTGFRCVSEIQ